MERRLRAGEDNDLPGITADSAELREVVSDRRAQIRQAARIREVQTGGPEFARRPSVEALPDLPGELAGVGYTRIERARNLRLSAGCNRRNGMAARRWLGRTPCPFTLHGRGQARNRRGHERTLTNGTFKKALLGELRIDLFQHAARNTVICGGLPRGGQSLTSSANR